jgi:hypothetical protein
VAPDILTQPAIHGGLREDTREFPRTLPAVHRLGDRLRQKITHYDIGGERFERIRYGDEPDADWGANTHACSVMSELHTWWMWSAAAAVMARRSLATAWKSLERPRSATRTFSSHTHVQRSWVLTL